MVDYQTQEQDINNIHVGGWKVEVGIPDADTGTVTTWTNLGIVDPSSNSSATGGEIVRVTPQNGAPIPVGTSEAQHTYTFVWLEPDLQKLASMGLGTYTPASGSDPAALEVGALVPVYLQLRLSNRKSNGIVRQRLYKRAYLQLGQVIESPGNDSDQTPQTMSLAFVCEQYLDANDKMTFYTLSDLPVSGGGA